MTRNLSDTWPRGTGPANDGEGMGQLPGRAAGVAGRHHEIYCFTIPACAVYLVVGKIHPSTQQTQASR